MALTRTAIGTQPDGSLLYHYASDGPVVITGPIRGLVTTSDGTAYDVSDAVVEVHPDHVDEVAALIGERYAAEGHPAHTDGEPFVYVPKES